MNTVEDSPREGTEPAPEGTEEAEPKQGDAKEPEGDSNDPLDAIQDPEARAEAKRHRAIARRNARNQGDDEPEPEKEPEPKAEPATKDDLKRIATADAKRNSPEEVQEAWDELMKIPLGGFDPLDSNSVAENMKKRFSIFQAEQASGDGESPEFDPTKSSTTPNGGGGGPKGKKEEPDLPGFKEPAQPEDWYPKE